MKIKAYALVLVLLLAGCVMTTPDHVAGKFCRLSMAPQHNDSAMRGLMSNGVQDLWDVAQKFSDMMARQNPGEKPPLGDGIQTQAYVDHMDICKVVGFSGTGDTREAEIYHGLASDPKAGWTDRLELITEAGSWVIDDIQFGPDFRQSLRMDLKNVIKQ